VFDVGIKRIFKERKHWFTVLQKTLYSNCFQNIPASVVNYYLPAVSRRVNWMVYSVRLFSLTFRS